MTPDDSTLDDLAAVLARPEIPVSHAALCRAYPTPAMEIPDCDGLVTVIWRRLDRTRDVTALVELYTCGKCDRRISLDATNRRILNSYSYQGAPTC